MDLVDAKVFISVGEELSFRRAADKLSYSVASVSNRIRRLERDLGVNLFVRTSRHVELTPAGRHLLKDAQVIVRSVDLMLTHAREFTTRVGTTFSIAYSPSAGPDALAFARTLRLLNEPYGAELVPMRSSPETVSAVRSRRAVGGVCRMADPRLRSMPLARAQPGAILMPIDHKLAGRSGIAVADLDGVQMLMWKRELNPEHFDLFLRFLHSHGATPQVREIEVIGVASLFEAVALGDGVAFTPLDTPCVPGTTIVPVVGPSPPLNQSYLLWSPEEHEAVVKILIAAAADVR